MTKLRAGSASAAPSRPYGIAVDIAEGSRISRAVFSSIPDDRSCFSLAPTAAPSAVIFSPGLDMPSQLALPFPIPALRRGGLHGSRAHVERAVLARLRQEPEADTLRSLRDRARNAEDSVVRPRREPELLHRVTEQLPPLRRDGARPAQRGALEPALSRGPPARPRSAWRSRAATTRAHGGARLGAPGRRERSAGDGRDIDVEVDPIEECRRAR